MLSAHLARAGERAAHIAPPRIVLQAHLRRRVADALATGGVERDAELLRHRAGDFAGVIETAFTDALRMQRHRNQPVGTRRMFHGLHQAVRQRRCDGELAVILQARDQPVERKRIGQCGMGAVERRRMPEAGAAPLAVWRGGGALRAVRLAMPGQLGVAAAAQGACAGSGAAEQAAVWKKLIKN